MERSVIKKDSFTSVPKFVEIMTTSLRRKFILNYVEGTFLLKKIVLIREFRKTNYILARRIKYYILNMLKYILMKILLLKYSSVF